MKESAAAQKPFLAGPLVLALFTLSGASALVYEVVWSRRFTFVFGAMSHAVATVLAAYMGGLALGSFLLGRWMERGGKPLRVYGWLEAGIGAWALVLPLLLSGLETIYGVAYRSWGFGPSAMTVLRLLLSFVVLLVPTTLMGGTLPVLSALAAPARASGWAGLLYALNTLGAVGGAAFTGFVLLPAFGMRISTFAAVAVNVAIASAALWAARKTRETPGPLPAARSEGPPTAEMAAMRSRRRAAMIAYALSGFAALSYEVLWTRVLAGTLGTTTYAFTTMLTTFLLGLGLGSLWASRWAVRWRDPVLVLGIVQVGAGLTALVTTPLLDRLPEAFLSLAHVWGISFGTLTLARFVLTSLIMLPTTLFLGAVFPLTVRLAGVDESPGRATSPAIGGLYAANTIGAIAGSVFTAFVIAPALGRQRTLEAAALLNAAVGIGLLVAFPVLGAAAASAARSRGGFFRGNRKWAAAATAAALLLVIPARSPWNLRLMNVGSYVYTRNLSGPGAVQQILDESQTIFMREDADVTASVWNQTNRGRQIRSLRINGKVEASTGNDMLTQELSAHLPFLLHPHPKRALVIGVASGITLGAVTRYPLERIDCAELSPAVTEAAGYFRDVNHDALSKPNVHLRVTDGRNHLLLTGERYDIITSQPSNPWISGITNLFTREFFLLAREKMAPDGLLCQWINVYDISQDDLRTAVRTFADVFPKMSAWFVGTSDLLLLGGEHATELDLAGIARRASSPEVAQDLAQVGIRDPYSLFAHYVMDGDEARAAAGTGPLVTDDNLILEYTAPRSQGSPESYLSSLEFVISCRRSPVPHITGWEALGATPAEGEAHLSRALEAQGMALDVLAHHMSDLPGRSKELREAYAVFDRDPLVNRLLGEAEMQLGLDASHEGRTAEAADHFAWALRVEPDNAALHYSMGVALGRMGQDAEALLELEQAVRLDPGYFDAHADLGVAYANVSRDEEAAAEWREALRLRPGDPRVSGMLAQIGRPAR